MESKKIIFYFSEHHNNTEKLIQEAAEGYQLEKVPSEITDVSKYDYIGFASGIYWGAFGEKLTQHIDKLTGLKGKKCFSICTSGSGSSGYVTAPKSAIEKKGGEFIGGFSCAGFDTYGIFRLIGGINKGHPDKTDVENCKKFLNSLK